MRHNFWECLYNTYTCVIHRYTSSSVYKHVYNEKPSFFTPVSPLLCCDVTNTLSEVFACTPRPRPLSNQQLYNSTPLSPPQFEVLSSATSSNGRLWNRYTRYTKLNYPSRRDRKHEQQRRDHSHQ